MDFLNNHFNLVCQNIDQFVRFLTIHARFIVIASSRWRIILSLYFKYMSMTSYINFGRGVIIVMVVLLLLLLLLLKRIKIHCTSYVVDNYNWCAWVGIVYVLW